ncbi:DEAD/DEAH box helicase [Mucilaginibacter boryungensis]|uniref:AAA family ATPase n=1 Tax=Mucilaginibacter boryungensis TaxID=768480 RepID=A0ABR9XL26_9SPHI|nr:DEAD/DEAH box helicase [Mucilaginibacter boryungensis]MBE9668087.1 AAA family ATPase [Mucilaginibacter boryungensis]
MSEEIEFLSSLQRIKKQDVEVLLKKAYRGIWETAIKKYSDSAHFIYELLQNADDTKATWVEFTLEADGLWFKHNGSVRFTISDPEEEDSDSETGHLGHINAITSIGNSTKIDEQKIGKFGIGFKAVFAYSLTPHIYDDSFNFKLENYIVPVEIAPNAERRKQGETLFYFPFNHKAKTKEDAYSEIEEKLESLFQPVLFLTNLERIYWNSTENKGEYSKKEIRSESFQKIKASLVEVTSVEDGQPKKEYIWLFSGGIVHAKLRSSHRIVVGFFVIDQAELETGYQYDAFCFFPTKEETKLGFIIQAPFLLTDSRERIKAGEQWNVDVMQLVAELAANSISVLKEIGTKDKSFLVNDNILELIPYKANDFSEINSTSKISFKPFYNTILQKFKTEAILPGRHGKYFSTAKAYWASDPELADLFSDQQISQLLDNPNSGWVFISKGQKQLNQANKSLETYISAVVTDILDPKKLLRRITAKFIEAQTDEWLLKFYSYLGGRKSLWDDKEKLALKRPILLNEHRKAVVPFDDEQAAPNIFLPTDRMTTYDTVYKPFTEDAEALEFFKGLGLGKPDLRAEIFKTIIPLYDDDFDYDDEDKILQHFESFITYYEICPASTQLDYIKKLQETTFIAARNPADPGTRYFCRPEDAYFNDLKLSSYFANTSEVYLLDDDFYIDYINSNKKDKFYSFLRGLGVSDVPKVKAIKLDVTTETKEQFALEGHEVAQTYVRNQVITDKTLEGLEDAVKHITPELSVIIWNYLLIHVQGRSISNANSFFCGVFQFVPKWSSYSKNEKFDSTLVSILKNDKWLFDKDLNLVSAAQLSRETIDGAYNTEDVYADVLLEFLGIENPDADLDLTDEQKLALDWGRKLLDEGITQAELAEFLNMINSRKKAGANQQEAGSKEQADVDDEEIEEMLSKLKKGIKKKRQIEAKGKANPSTQSDVEPEVPDEPLESMVDQDEYSKPTVDLQKKIDKLKEQTEAQIEDLTRIEKLNDIANESEKYSFAWFKALLELEYLSSSEANSQGKQVLIQFTKVEKEPGTERTLILKHPNRYIPQSIEDIGDLQIRIYQGDESKTVSVEVVSVKEYTLRAKLKKSVDISEIDLGKVTRVVIDIKNPVFIIEELRKAFYQLNFEDDFNFQTNLTENIRFIFGPPGTGKTTYLAANEIIPLMKEDEPLKVLVLTPTNKAADVLTKRIIEKMGPDESYYSWLLRFGTTADAELEASPIIIDKNFDIRTRPKNTTITTIARFAYDYFQPDQQEDRLHLKFLQWDYIIIDEASMIALASIAYVLYQKPDSKFIIAGDPFQIQPITQIDQWKDMNIYHMVELDRFLDPVTVPHQYEVKNLQKQYRSLPTIGNVFSHFTYKGILEHHRTADEQKQLNIDGLHFKDINIIKFPVSKYESIFKPNTLNKSNYQVYSALFSVEFAKHLCHQIESTHKDKFRIGIICPYKAQATLIEKLLAQQHTDTEKAEVLVGTIHGFQGDECDIIIAIFNPPFSISKSPGRFLNKQNILNVSISRARDYLFIFMPDDDTQDVNNLYKIKQIERLVNHHAKGRCATYNSNVVEEKIFGSSTYIYDNSFATSHQSVNVYSKPEKKYEVRCEEVAIDVQIKHFTS